MPTPEKMDAVALLKADHRKVEDLFEKFESAKGADRGVGSLATRGASSGNHAFKVALT